MAQRNRWWFGKEFELCVSTPHNSSLASWIVQMIFKLNSWMGPWGLRYFVAWLPWGGFTSIQSDIVFHIWNPEETNPTYNLIQSLGVGYNMYNVYIYIYTRKPHVMCIYDIYRWFFLPAHLETPLSFYCQGFNPFSATLKVCSTFRVKNWHRSCWLATDELIAESKGKCGYPRESSTLFPKLSNL